QLLAAPPVRQRPLQAGVFPWLVGKARTRPTWPGMNTRHSEVERVAERMLRPPASPARTPQASSPNFLRRLEPTATVLRRLELAARRNRARAPEPKRPSLSQNSADLARV